MKQIKKLMSISVKWSGTSALTVLVVALSIITPVSVNAKSLSYVLECRGGGGIIARIYNVGSVKVYGYRFAKVAASVRPPGLGECAWLDRPMSNKEHLPLYYSHRKLPFSYVNIRSNGTKFRWWETLPITSVIKAVQNNKLFFVHVKTKRINNRWMFNVVRVGP